MKIYCINLARSADRRAFQKDQAARLGLTIEFIDAVDYKCLAESTLVNAAQSWTRPIVGKDVGCFLSHRRAWELVGFETEPAIIMEDDVMLSKDFCLMLANLRQHDFPPTRIYDLEFVPRKHVLARGPLWKTKTFIATQLFINKNGAGCYALRPEAARRLSSEATSYVMIDSWMWTRPWIEQVQIEPCPAVQLSDVSRPRLTINQATSGEKPREFNQQSWLRKKMIRLSLTIDQTRPFLRYLLSGVRRPLMWNRSDFEDNR